MTCAISRYFEWVAGIQRVLQSWKEKICGHNISYDEVFWYATNHYRLVPLANAFRAGSLVISLEDVQDVKNFFLRDFELLNTLLLRYIPDGKWCSFPALLEEYGVCLPREDQEFLNSKVSFPGSSVQIPEDQLGSPLNPNISRIFQPSHDICLRLHKSVSLRELSSVMNNLEYFLRPLTKDLILQLIFFKLSKSELFDKYLRNHIQAQSQETQDTQHATPGLDIPLVTPPVVHPNLVSPDSEGLSMSSFTSALKAASNLILKIMLGEATFSEIIMGDRLMLQKLEIEGEFTILSKYVQVAGLPDTHCKGLSGVQSMLELFQYATHIKNIRLACEQYHLKNCLDDPLLEELTKIMQDHTTEEGMSEMTPLMAIEKMKRVKEILCLEGRASSRCLDLFQAIMDSAAFYQFVRDKQFYGLRGEANFVQQYQLITAQLQHEEYDDQVLNHLYAAFKVISPFVDTEKNFTELMKAVMALNIASGLKQLETVNTNITLIRLWFSRAEVSVI